VSHDDFEVESTPGLPADLPQGERLLWQGVPKWKSLAIHAYHVRKVALYFLFLVLWRAGAGVINGQGFEAIALACGFMALLGAIAVGVLCLLAYASTRATIYSVTTRRVLIRHGVAVQMTLNIPFRFIESAGLRLYSDGTGDISLGIDRKERIGYLITWPHLRAWQLTRPQPSFRSLADSREAADLLSAALAAEAGAAPVRMDYEAAPSLGPRTAAAA